jgi:hypothetical protein
VYRDNFTLLFVLRFVSKVLHVPSFDGSVRVVTSVDRTETHKMLVVLPFLRKLGNLWKDNFDCFVVYIVKGTSNSSCCVSTRPTECFNIQSAFYSESEIEFRMILRIRGKHWISHLAFVTEIQCF